MLKKKKKVSNHDLKKRVCIGKIAGAHGVKGLVKIKPFCDDITLLNGKLFTDETTDKICEIEIKSNAGKHLLAKVMGITSREEAEKCKDMLYITRETLPETDDNNEFYVVDLIGLAVYENKEEIGIIATVENFGAGDLMEVKPQSGTAYYIPFQDDYIENIDLENKVITLQNIEHFKGE